MPGLVQSGSLGTGRPASGNGQASGADASEPSYYDIPLLKAPVWGWEIPAYFFLGGLSAGAFILSRLADRFGPRSARGVTRAGAIAAFAALLPCPPLLIADLGEPRRFHHMLRVWKPTSPMNLGTWTITAYSGFATAAIVREFLRGKPREQERMHSLAGATVLALEDAAGIPIALLLASYTGVLLSCTANPLWCKNTWLAPHFAASAVSAGADTITLGLTMTGRGRGPAMHAMDRIGTLAHVSEAATLAGLVWQAGEKAKPMSRGTARKRLVMGLGSLLLSEGVRMLPAEGSAKTVTRLASAGLGLFGGFCIRSAIFDGGRAAAQDPRLARLASRPEQGMTRTRSREA